LKPYGHLTSEERARIEILRKQGAGPTAISEQIGRAKSTVSRELRRLGAGTEYEAARAQAAAEQLARKARREPRLTAARRREVITGLTRGWSPQQIAGRWQAQGRPARERVSHETIYQMIGADRQTGGELWRMLPRGGRRRRRDRCGTRRGHRLPVAPAEELAQRPAVLNGRERYGDREVDLVIGGGPQGVLLVAYERVSRRVKLRVLADKSAAEVSRGLRRLLRGEVVLSLTYDRGLEWMDHAAIAASCGAQSYFCRPYHSWEPERSGDSRRQKGGVENVNGLIRCCLPKAVSFGCEKEDRSFVARVERQLNRRPRRILGYRTPEEIAQEHLRAAA